jgi:lipopolysaccharide/colanic/teichoic acid biosynthesis glycosyltransferase
MELVLVNQPRVSPRRKTYSIVKRVFDCALCILILPFVLPIMMACALAIHLDDPDGPILFVQERIGKGGHTFRIFKFRTMKADLDDSQGRAFMRAYVRGAIDSDSHGTKVYKPTPAQHILRVGRFMRKTSLDELPQMINVLRGEMSIVGPRPNVPWEVDAYHPWHYERLEVLPGITGLAQIRGRSSIGFNSLVRADIEYIEKQSLALDLQILWSTLASIVHCKGAM